ncbi:helix-turn-helix domain-containing protein [Aliivibrio fischeri]|uniref:helix-turn-helix domain-containing protein n=1 Tax=Aliivibrio fischeri TaxID=668 RepID=UPI00105C9251|nr:winged helix-turn-helix domain-containing protein [Aliivibrio fischeri]TDM53721.1 hypothetical protein VFFQA001_03765 [Aliivibrio fischeri]
MQKNIIIGSYLVNLKTGALTNIKSKNQEKKTLTKKLLEFLIVLYEGEGKPVNKQDIIKKVWAGHTSPENITQTVNKLRLIFNDNNKNLIVNYQSIGYGLNYKEQKGIIKSESKFNKIIINKKIRCKTISALAILSLVMLILLNLNNNNNKFTHKKSGIHSLGLNLNCEIMEMEKLLVCI